MAFWKTPELFLNLNFYIFCKFTHLFYVKQKNLNRKHYGTTSKKLIKKRLRNNESSLFIITQSQPKENNPNPDFEGLIFAFAVLKYSAIRQDYLRFCLAQPKIRSLKILRPEKDRILSRFWCGRCSKADALQRWQAKRCRNYAFSGGFGLLSFG